MSVIERERERMKDSVSCASVSEGDEKRVSECEKECVRACVFVCERVRGKESEWV